jgi:hypothetical protein
VRSLSRLRRRSSLRRAAAALAAAAVVWTVVALVVGANGAALWSSFPVAAGGLGAYAWFRAGPWGLGSYAAGLLLTAPALYASLGGVLVIGCFAHAGDAHAWMYVVGVVAGASGVGWSVRRPMRAFWGLPLSVLLAILLVPALAAVFNHGGTAWCPE